MTTLRVSKTEKFTIISNVHLNDSRLSWKATAILTYLLSKPNDWSVSVEHLAKAKQCGVKAVFSGVKELKELGYIEHVFLRDGKGRISRGEYIVHEEPVEVETPEKTETPTETGSVPYAQNGHTAKRQPVKRHAENRRLLNTDRIPSTEFTKNDDDTAEPQTPLPADPPPKEKKPSSSFAFEISLVPERFRNSEFLIEKIRKGLEKYEQDYVRDSLIYARDKSRAQRVDEFSSFFGRTLENGWAVKYVSVTLPPLENQAKLDRLRREEQEQDRKRREEQARLKVMHEALVELQETKPEKYAALEKQAADALGLKLHNLKSVIGGGLKVKHKMFEIVEQEVIQ